MNKNINNTKLPVVTGRYNNTEYADRHCNLCNCGCLGDESHYLFDCPHFSKARVFFINRSIRDRPSASNVNKVFNAKYADVCRLAKFCKIIMKEFN